MAAVQTDAVSYEGRAEEERGTQEASREAQEEGQEEAMTKCVCGKVLGPSVGDVTVTRTPCRCGLPARVIVPGAPHIWWPMGDPKRAALGLPDKTPAEEAAESNCKWV